MQSNMLDARCLNLSSASFILQTVHCLIILQTVHCLIILQTVHCLIILQTVHCLIILQTVHCLIILQTVHCLIIKMFLPPQRVPDCEQSVSVMKISSVQIPKFSWVFMSAAFCPQNWVVATHFVKVRGV